MNHPARIILTVVLALCAAASLQAQNKITSLPYTIKYPGVYVLATDLTYLPQDGTAITITCGNVLLDFQGHTLTNPNIRLDYSSAISASGMDNVRVRNEKISGFANGISSVSTVINMTLSKQSSVGIAGGTAVINCSVLDTGYYNYPGDILGDPVAVLNVGFVQNCTISCGDGRVLAFYGTEPHAPYLVINCRLSGYELIINYGTIPVLAIHDDFITKGVFSILGNVTIIDPVKTGSPLAAK